MNCLTKKSAIVLLIILNLSSILLIHGFYWDLFISDSYFRQSWGILPQRLDKLYDPDIKLFTKPAFM